MEFEEFYKLCGETADSGRRDDIRKLYDEALKTNTSMTQEYVNNMMSAYATGRLRERFENQRPRRKRTLADGLFESDSPGTHD